MTLQFWTLSGNSDALHTGLGGLAVVLADSCSMLSDREDGKDKSGDKSSSRMTSFSLAETWNSSIVFSSALQRLIRESSRDRFPIWILS
ncbi:unnamed protein product [Pseudo-nitzschia multistriata]|uniref:Uncharacterized protein n=1 Tax=Pseudo-nitzschia multistriata TaxID=183589 RepID=A0A448ZN25_9STRA|nr:unnamed protein product [Pseudo-nitzschia multistriata]